MENEHSSEQLAPNENMASENANQEVSQHPFESRIDLQPLANSTKRIKEEISKIIVGQTKVIDLLLTAILSDGHILLEGVPGVAKTLMAKLIAQTVSTDFSRIQFTPDLMPSDVIGTTVFNLKDSTFDFRKGPIFSNIVLIDEINRSPAKTQSALFEVMEERQITIDGEQFKMSPPFVVIATQNPVEQEGTYQLPEAQRDRFLFKISVDYPNLNEEMSLLKRFNQVGTKADLSVVQSVISAEQLIAFKQLVSKVYIEDNLLQYIVNIVGTTRKSKDLFLGASPRASLAMMNASKAYAALQGRDFVTPEDIQFITPYVLNHRIILSAEKELEGSNSMQVTKDILKIIEVPR